MLPYSISEKALEELSQAINYYKKTVDADCAEIFAIRFKETLNLICHYPQAWPNVRPKFRRCNLKGYPYFVLYQIQENSRIVIVSILHSQSDHDYYMK